MVDIIVAPVVNTVPTPQNRSAANKSALKGRVVAVRNGRKRKRRQRSIPFEQTITERRCKQESRKSQIMQDNTTTKILLFRVESNSDLSSLIDKEVTVRVAGA